MGFKPGRGKAGCIEGSRIVMPVSGVDEALHFPLRMLRYPYGLVVVDLAGDETLPSEEAVYALARAGDNGSHVVVLGAVPATRTAIVGWLATGAGKWTESMAYDLVAASAEEGAGGQGH